MTVTEAVAFLPPAAVAAVATCVLHRRGGLPAWQALVYVLLGIAGGPASAGGPAGLCDQVAGIWAQVTSWAGRPPQAPAVSSTSTASGKE